MLLGYIFHLNNMLQAKNLPPPWRRYKTVISAYAQSSSWRRCMHFQKFWVLKVHSKIPMQYSHIQKLVCPLLVSVHAQPPALVSWTTPSYFHSAGCIASPVRGERGSGNSGRSAMSPAGISAEPMGLQWSHDIEVGIHRNVIIELSVHVHEHTRSQRDG